MSAPRDTHLPEVAQYIERDLDRHISALYTLYDTTRALPHPYDAVHSQASKLLHDFAGLASSTRAYLATDPSLQTEAPQPQAVQDAPEECEHDWPIGLHTGDACLLGCGATRG